MADYRLQGSRRACYASICSSSSRSRSASLSVNQTRCDRDTRDGNQDADARLAAEPPSLLNAPTMLDAAVSTTRPRPTVLMRWSASSAGRPRLDLHAVLSEERLSRDLLVERVRLDLIHRGRDLVEDDQVHHAVEMLGLSALGAGDRRRRRWGGASPRRHADKREPRSPRGDRGSAEQRTGPTCPGLLWLPMLNGIRTRSPALQEICAVGPSVEVSVGCPDRRDGQRGC